jgi:hypothetical protein
LEQKENKMKRLENWYMFYAHSEHNPYAAPETLPGKLCGIAYDHPSFEDGKEVITSRVVCLDLKKGKAWTKTGSVYYLGMPDSNYAKKFPVLKNFVPRSN